jgi:hypothetical protein
LLAAAGVLDKLAGVVEQVDTYQQLQLFLLQVTE